jgi:hypothetical protein
MTAEIEARIEAGREETRRLQLAIHKLMGQLNSNDARRPVLEAKSEELREVEQTWRKLERYLYGDDDDDPQKPIITRH